jgi:hypothetical protein
VTELKLYDPVRDPASWTEILRPGQFVAFAKTLETGAACDSHGRPFRAPEDATCLLFDSLAEAKAHCEDHVEGAPDVRFEVFDSTARANPPLLVIVHSSRIARLEGNSRGIRLRNGVITMLVLLAAASFCYDFMHGERLHFFPTLLGINLVVVAARLFQLNRSYAHAETLRRRRLADIERAENSSQLPKASRQQRTI